MVLACQAAFKIFCQLATTRRIFRYKYTKKKLEFHLINCTYPKEDKSIDGSMNEYPNK
jgi:hypothetical protein